MAEFITNFGQKLIDVHDRSECKGYCPIHNPSNHHMKDWPLYWRDDRKIFERICSCGVGHPDPDDMAYKQSIGVNIDVEGIHGCCGCCSKKEN